MLSKRIEKAFLALNIKKNDIILQQFIKEIEAQETLIKKMLEKLKLYYNDYCSSCYDECAFIPDIDTIDCNDKKEIDNIIQQAKEILK